MTFPRGLVDRYKQEYNFVYYPPNSCLFRSLKFLFFFVGETIHCPFYVFFNLSKKILPNKVFGKFHGVDRF